MVRPRKRIEQHWYGVTKAGTWSSNARRTLERLADKAKRYDWPAVLQILAKAPEFVNEVRPGSTSQFTPLHQAAHGGAPPDVVRVLVRLGAWRTVRNARGQRPVDIAQARGHGELLAVLAPALERRIPEDVLQVIERCFHQVILGRAAELVEDERLRLPPIEPLCERMSCAVWFPIPGMYGGFHFWLAGQGRQAKLVAESWCRVVDGSGERHWITAKGAKLVAEGFV